VVQKDTDNNGTIDYTDTYTGIMRITTNSYNDTITGSSSDDQINTGSGDDVIYATTGGDVITGGAGSDTVYYTSLSGTVNVNLVLGTTLKSAGGSDQLTAIEKIYLNSGNDTFQTNGTSFSSYTTLDGGGGRDTIMFSSGTIGTNVEAANFASMFKNMEAFDLRNAALNSGDNFQMTTNDIINMTSSARTLDVYMNTGFNLALSTSSGYTLAGDSTVGNLRTVTYTKSAETNVTLHVYSY
jgi:hypothetical protein